MNSTLWIVLAATWATGVPITALVIGLLEGSERDAEGPDVAACLLWPLVVALLIVCGIGWCFIHPFTICMRAGAAASEHRRLRSARPSDPPTHQGEAK